MGLGSERVIYREYSVSHECMKFKKLSFNSGLNQAPTLLRWGKTFTGRFELVQTGSMVPHNVTVKKRGRIPYEPEF